MESCRLVPPLQIWLPERHVVDERDVVDVGRCGLLVLLLVLVAGAGAAHFRRHWAAREGTTEDTTEGRSAGCSPASRHPLNTTNAHDIEKSA